LWRAGLPYEIEALVVSIGEAWAFLSFGLQNIEPSFTSEAIFSTEVALSLAKQASERIKSDFPAWNVQHLSATGSPARALIEKADEWKPDLLILGSHGHTASGRFFFGSVSQTVVTHAHRSVRGRARRRDAVAPVRIIIGADGSRGAEAAVQAVASRQWPEGSEARVVSGFQTLPMFSAQLEQHENFAAQVAEWIGEARHRATEINTSAAEKLRKSRLITSSVVKEKNPKQLLLSEAEDWDADCIFVGARGLSGFERFWLGSVSTAVVSRAHCSVEVVRS
jgi:nucleotide-binding universal stress UspA family protein